ncbi:hypothetical protein ILYODFUR_032444, partial [Ilyodon furcidens]
LYVLFAVLPVLLLIILVKVCKAKHHQSKEAEVNIIRSELEAVDTQEMMDGADSCIWLVAMQPEQELVCVRGGVLGRDLVAPQPIFSSLSATCGRVCCISIWYLARTSFIQ